MPDPVSAVAGVGAVAGAYGANKQSKAAKAAAKAQERAAANQLAWEKERYRKDMERWESIYGSTERNLGEYYSTLDSDFYAVKNLETFQQEQQQAMANIRESLAQRGLADSGVAVAAETQAELQGAMTRADIRRSAEEQVAQQKMNFLSVGKGNMPTSAGVSQAMSNITQVAGQRAAAANQSALFAQQQATQAIGQATYQIATGLSQSQSQPMRPEAVK